MIRIAPSRSPRLIEDALQHQVAALREIPDDVVVPSRLVLGRESFAERVAEIESLGKDRSWKSAINCSSRMSMDAHDVLS
jgi:hypothetical protein